MVNFAPASTSSSSKKTITTSFPRSQGRGGKASTRDAVAEPSQQQNAPVQTFQRRPEDVVRSNGKEVELFALKACVKRQESGQLAPKMNVVPSALEPAFERCREVTAEYAKTFYLGTKLMTPEKQRAIWAIYVWCRRTDELVDGPNASHITPEALDKWEERLENIFAGKPLDVVDATLADTVSKFPVDIQPFRDMVDGMRMDLVKPRYETFDELYEYCYRVAGTVGLMSMPIMGLDENYRGDLQSVYKAALSLGLANQLTNILRDVGEDARERNRIYVPLEDLAEFGITEDEVLTGLVKTVRWTALGGYEVSTQERECFASAEAGVNGIKTLDGRYGLPWMYTEIF